MYVLHSLIALYAVFCSVLLCSASLCAVRMIQVARQEGLNVEQNAAEILVEQVRFTNPFTLILLYPSMPCHALPCHAILCPVLPCVTYLHPFKSIRSQSTLHSLISHYVVTAHLSR